MGLNNDIKVSVVLSVYNAGEYLRQTLDSVLRQSLKEIEIICVDDMSSDNSLEILEEYKEIDGRISVMQTTEISDGAAVARNLGISYATGQYVSVLDSDDFFEPDMLEKAYERAESSGAEIVIFDGWVYDEKIKADLETGIMIDRRCIGKTRGCFKPVEYRDNLFQLTLGAAWNCIFSRDLIVRDHLSFWPYHHADDLGFVYLGFACAKSITVIDNRLIHYRRNTGIGQGDNAYKWPGAFYDSLASLKNELDKRNLYETFKVSFAQAAMRYALFYLGKMNTPDGFRDFYNELREKDLKEFGVFDLPEDKFIDKHWAFMRNVIKLYGPYEYLYRRFYRLKPFEDGFNEWKKKIAPGSKVAIYGAGEYGRKITAGIISEHTYNLCIWVDKKYVDIGYPVCDPEILKDTEFDYVIVAVISADVYRTIEEFLRSIGINKSKIVWIGNR